MLKVAIVGCGKIADSHVTQIRRISGCKIVAACDRELLMARQLCQRFSIEKSCGDLAELLAEAKPDVVHITTPPESHLPLAKMCIQRGAHVYVEKPFTLNEPDARELIGLAEQHHRKITAGHDDQFTHPSVRTRELVRSGYLGAGPVHLESYYCYELGGSAYAGALLGDKQHWVRRLPGKLLQNIISHGIARVAEYIQSDAPKVIAHGFISPYLRAAGETEIVDELRVIINDQDRLTAYFTFSSQMRPALHHFRIYGSRNGIAMDHDQNTVVKLRGNRYPSYAEKFIPALNLGGQYLGNFSNNLKQFMKRDFHMKSGMKRLIESFYRSIDGNQPDPIPHREILLTALIMDDIFRQLNSTRSEAVAVPASSALPVGR